MDPTDHTNPHNIHHITYDFCTAGLSPAAVAIHVADARDELSAHFDIEREKVNVRKGPGVETDIVVMVGAAGKNNDDTLKVKASRVVFPMLRYLLKHGQVTAAREDGFAQRVLTLVRPRQSAGVR